MLEDLDESLKQLLVQKGKLDAGEVDIAFEAPTRDWAAGVSKPTVNFYLYDVRENSELREGGYWHTETKEQTSLRRRLPIRLDLSYVVTAWTTAIEDEHRLLSRLLLTLVKYPVLPKEVLQGPLARLEWDIPTQVAQSDGASRSVTDFWTALGTPLKAAINYQVTMTMDPDVAVSTKLVFTRKLSFKPPVGGPTEELLAIAGYVRRQGKTDEVVPGAQVAVKEEGIFTVSDAGGRFRIPRMPPGHYTLEVSIPGKKVREVKVTIPQSSYDLEV